MWTYLAFFPVCLQKHCNLFSIEWIFPMTECMLGNYLLANDAEYQDWLNTVSVISRNMNILKLNLTLDLSGFRCS
jgi:hypothetical protein